MTTPAQHVLSVMVVSLNEAPHLANLKAALDRLQRPPGWRLETILVDGGSTDNSVDVARQAGFDECAVLPGASIPVCRNQALRMARGNALAFLDGDCVPARDWLMHAAPWLLKLTPVMLGYPVRPPKTGNWVQRAWHAHWHLKNPAAQTDTNEPVTTEAFRLITTRNMLFNRALLDVVPSFDESSLHGEDTDFAFRASQAVAKCSPSPPSTSRIGANPPRSANTSGSSSGMPIAKPTPLFSPAPAARPAQTPSTTPSPS